MPTASTLETMCSHLSSRYRFMWSGSRRLPSGDGAVAAQGWLAKRATGSHKMAAMGRFSGQRAQGCSHQLGSMAVAASVMPIITTKRCGIGHARRAPGQPQADDSIHCGTSQHHGCGQR